MKPTDWDIWTPDQKKEYVVKLFQSLQGQYIISQALYYGIKAVRAQQNPEESNAQDMEMFRECIFPWFIDPNTLKEMEKANGLQDNNSAPT